METSNSQSNYQQWERIAIVENRLERIETDLAQIKQTTSQIEKLLGLLKWIGGGIIAIAFSLIARFVSREMLQIIMM